jgi:hypothetical protein
MPEPVLYLSDSDRLAVLGVDMSAPEQLDVVSDHGLIDWSAWYAETRGKVRF